MFSWVQTPEGGKFLIATRNSSILVQNQEDLENIDSAKYYKHIELANQFFAVVSGLSQKSTAELKNELSEQTWVGEYLSSDYLVHYAGGETLVLHSMVENESGVVIADAENTFKHFGFNTF